MTCQNLLRKQPRVQNAVACCGTFAKQCFALTRIIRLKGVRCYPVGLCFVTCVLDFVSGQLVQNSIACVRLAASFENCSKPYLSWHQAQVRKLRPGKNCYRGLLSNMTKRMTIKCPCAEVAVGGSQPLNAITAYLLDLGMLFGIAGIVSKR